MVVIIFNNGGVYGGDWCFVEDIVGFYKDDFVLMFFVLGVCYDLVMEVFGGKGYLVENFEEF